MHVNCKQVLIRCAASTEKTLVSCPDHTPHFATREAGSSGNNRQKACIFLTLGLEFETTNEIIGWLIITGKLLSYAIEPH